VTTLSKAQRQALELIEGGAKPWQDHDDYTLKEIWWLRHDDPNQGPRTLNVGTATALVKRKLIEPTGMLYWRLSDAGRAALAEARGPA